MSPHRLAGIGALLHAGLEIVRGEGGVDRIGRIGRRIERDHQHAGITGLLDDVEHAGRIVRRDQDALGTGADQVLDGGDLTFVVAVELAGAGDQLDALLLGARFGRLAHLDEEWIDLGFRDEADDYLAGGSGSRAQGKAENEHAGGDAAPQDG